MMYIEYSLNCLDTMRTYVKVQNDGFHSDIYNQQFITQTLINVNE